MYEYNYQRMLDERREQYERRLPNDPAEQAVLAERIEYLRRNANLFNRMKQIIASECVVAGNDERPVQRLVESPEMEELLDEFQEKIFAMTVKAERINELDTTRDPLPPEIFWQPKREKPQLSPGLSRSAATKPHDHKD